MSKNDGCHQRSQNADDESEASRQDHEHEYEPQGHKQPETGMGKKTSGNKSRRHREE